VYLIHIIMYPARRMGKKLKTKRRSKVSFKMIE